MRGPGARAEPAPTEGQPAPAPSQMVVLVRHGETEWSRTGRHTGRSDIPLDPEGEEQARWLRQGLRGWRFAEVLCSPLQRAWRTCEIAGWGGVARREPRIQEWDYGDYEGRTADQIRAQHPGWSIWADGVVGGESLADVARRADSVIDGIRSVVGDVAVFAHGHLLRILAARWCGLSALTGEHLALSAGAMSVLGSDRGDPIIWRWNDTAHLPGGDPRR